MDIGVLISQVVAAGIGAMGFSMMFNSGKRNLLPSTIGGVIGWVLYVLFNESGLGVFVSAVITAAFCQIYSEVLARVLKSPAIVFYIPAIIPMVPGGSLYYTMYYATMNDWANFKYNGWITLQVALGIAIGTSFVSAVLLLLPKKAKV